MDDAAARVAAGDRDDVVAVYLTFPNETSALDVARTLLDRRLVACVNVLPGATSMYRWEGEIVRERESVAVAKTTRRCVPAVAEAIGEAHPYEVPCVVAYPSVGGLGAYLDWVRAAVAASGQEHAPGE